MTTAITHALDATLEAAKVEIQTILDAQRTEAIRFADSSRQRTYRVAQHLLRLGRVLLLGDNRAEFASLLMRNAVTVRAGTNEWAYVVELALPGDKTWKNRAGALRALDHYCSKDATDKAAEFIDKFAIQTVKKATDDTALADAIGDSQAARLDGLALVDRLRHRDPQAPTDADFLSAARAAEPLNIADLKITDPKAEFVMIWAQVVNGGAVPMAVVEGSEALAKKAAIATGKLLHSKPSGRELEDAVDRKVGDFVFGDELAGTTEPTFVREAGALTDEVGE
ncbi:MAG: hypothetical protein ACI8U3_000955 [Brevundimonas sp.]|jgi:hypothetical protein|uniref:hypothetical protein n=1 Tax=Brevundimonas sp. TaxID=1871086 RepID=UPI0039E4C038